jgi:N-acetylglucosaminyl-diphospho-decaprenol L-rhamnosyltransferase
MDLAVIVVSYNVRELLAACLKSLYADLGTSALDATVWVVDNASADSSAEMVRRDFPDVRLIISSTNVGFAAGNNLALRAIGLDQPELPASVPRHILLLNPDTEVLPGALTTLTRFLDEMPEAGACGPALLYPNGRFQHSAFAFPTLWQITFDFFPLHGRLLDSRLNGRYPRRLYQAGEPFPIDHPLGAALMVRSAVVAQVGLLDEGFFMYCEEIDWCLRIRERGWTIYCVPRAQIMHHAGGSTSQFREAMFVALWRSRYRLFAKHDGAFFLWVARQFVRLGLWAEARRARQRAARGEIAADELERRLAAYWEVLLVFR